MPILSAIAAANAPPSATALQTITELVRSERRLAAALLRTPEAARFLNLSGRTPEKHRTYGTGPAYRKIGGRVVYALDDLKAWADRDTKTSTSDPGNGTVLPAKRQAAPIPYAGKSRR